MLLGVCSVLAFHWLPFVVRCCALLNCSVLFAVRFDFVWCIMLVVVCCVLVCCVLFAVVWCVLFVVCCLLVVD